MAHYLIEASGSPETYAAMIKAPHDRAVAIQPLMEKLGCKLMGYYFAVGQAKHYLILESEKPLDPIMSQVVVLLNMATGASTSVNMTQLLTSAEMVEALKQAPSMDYRPPTM